ncbi:MobF family relaxase [Sphingopyxis alaskensis]|jgi:conjugative relaxase-like TrwC/TraI family protein|uniref:MobF family relaxase n=1 Tax=Sphingopyxis alaskensis TaxID=117207 RepID=UPI00199B4B33|nr:MobF family relaxase [Sphingopyxis alaskensis]MBD3744818.1 relaxase domain-containing protein [Sphingopyxis terrae]MCM3418767.1 relaxase domain-containing protein [Sphingopyxis alaskensis]
MIHPRRLKGTPRNIARYYTVGDYYTKGTDEHSEWGGKLAAELGLEGRVDPATFQALLDGKVGDQQLGRHRKDGRIEHHPGWDFAVNAPKSVSIMALVASDERIGAAHERAVGVALAYLEEHATLRHREEGKIVHETTGRLIFARFTEHASRELDPHLHTHVVVLNMTNRGEGSPMASLETRAMFAEQMTAGQVYRNELAHKLKELGYEIDFDPRKGLFEIRGVPHDLIASFSQRAAQIDEHAREHGLTGQAARRRSFYETRGPKEKVSLEALHGQWTARLGQHREVTEKLVDPARDGERTPSVDAIISARAMLFGIRQSEGREAVNNLGQLFRAALASHVGEVRLDDVRPLAEEHEARRKLIETRHETGDQIHTRGRTSRRTARIELALADHLALALDDARPIASRERLLEIAETAGLNPAQQSALLHIGTNGDRVVGVHGVAGAGKSTLVDALREAADVGTTLIALAPTSSAAAELGLRARIESRTVASLIAGGGRKLDDSHVLVVDEAGQLGNRQTLRVLEISRLTGARVILLGDNRQTGAIEQGKAFWLMQRLGLSKAELTESVRQETRTMKAAVTQARLQNYSGSLANLDRVTSGASAEKLAELLVDEWTRLKPENRANTNILVLENATRLIVNTKVREALKAEGAIAAEDARLSVLTSTGMTDQEKHFARFYSGGQVLVFARDQAGLGIARDAEYRVVGTTHDARGRQVIKLVDEHGRVIQWNPRLGRASQVNVFKAGERDLAAGDRIQWRLVNHDLRVRNADRGTVERLDGTVATIRWDRDARVQTIDLGQHKHWDHGYAETVYSAQSKTYDRIYVLAPVNSPLVTAQNYYTAITRARFGVKLWTEDPKRLANKLARNSGEKTSSLEGLGRLDRDNIRGRGRRHGERLDALRQQQRLDREERKERLATERVIREQCEPRGIGHFLASRAHSAAATMDRWLSALVDRERGPSTQAEPTEARLQPQPARDHASQHGGGHER